MNPYDSIKSKVDIDAKIQITLDENEARALDAIVGYGPDAFIKWFYANHGKHYLKPHESAMRSLFDKVRIGIGQHLNRIDNARKAVDQESLKFYTKPNKVNQ